jgi:hypothetical protein
MNNLHHSILSILLGSVVAAVISPALLIAQAPPGPISATPVPSAPRPVQIQPPAPERPQIEPRKSIVGAWRLNRDESSSPDTQDDRRNGGNFPGGNGGNYPGGNGPYGGNPRYPGGGYPGGGYPGGGYPGGGYPGGNGPYGGNPRNGGGYPDDNDPALRQQLLPATRMSIEQKDNEIDLIDDRGQRTALFTDGRKLQKSKSNDLYREIAAHWEGSQLVTDEKSVRGDKMNRTFELSSEGLQLIETVRVDNNRSRVPLNMRYVYDVSRN